MKYLLVLLLMSSHVQQSYCQPAKSTAGKSQILVPKKDSSEKIIPLNENGMPENSSNIKTPNIPATNISVITSNEPATLDELNKKINLLQQQIDYLSNKLPFQNMAVLVLEAGQSNMQLVTSENETFYKHVIKINNPLSNGNPDAIIFAMRHENNKIIQATNIFYDQQDKFWYLKVPDKNVVGLEPYKVLDNLYFRSSDYKESGLNTNSFKNTVSLAKASPSWPVPGTKYSVLIFKQMVIRPGMNSFN